LTGATIREDVTTNHGPLCTMIDTLIEVTQNPQVPPIEGCFNLDQGQPDQGKNPDRGKVLYSS